MIQTIRLDQAQYVGTSESKGDVSLPAVHQEMLGAAERLLTQSPRTRTQISGACAVGALDDPCSSDNELR
jgi:hypothetical protein